MDYQGLQLNHFEHDTFQIKVKGKVIYIDPYKLTQGQIEPADYVFITHEHFDHCSVEDIEKIINENTVVVASEQCEERLKDYKTRRLILVKPGQKIELDDLKVEAVPAYNLDKWRSEGVLYHSLEDNKVGFVLDIAGVRIYHAGDTDNIPEMSEIKDIDIALLPVSGTYVMTALEAIKACGVIKPKVAIPMHYSEIVGSVEDAEKFRDGVECEVEII